MPSLNVSRLFLVAAAAALALAHRPEVRAAAPEQFITAYLYSEGPYSAAAAALAAGMLDYLQMLNERDGGVHGVKFTWEKCDNRYDSSRGLQCYERAKGHRPGATLVHPVSTESTYALIERASADRIALVSVGYGRADAADGRVFPYVFPLVTTSWSQAAAMVRYLAMRAGGTDNLRGKRVVLLYYDTADGKDAIPVLSALAAKYGYTLATIGVSPPGTGQDEQWLKIRGLRPDWLIVWGGEAMRATALESAARAGFPRNRMLGSAGAGAEGALTPPGRAAEGFVVAAFTVPGVGFPVIRDIRSLVYDRGGGALYEPTPLGLPYYNRGVVFGILTAEAVRVAQEHFGAGKPVSAEQAQWGLEHLQLDAARLDALGAHGLMPPVVTSCADHEGSGKVRFMRWDGKRWDVGTDWLAPLPDDRAAVQRLYAESATAYAKGKGIEPRRCPEG